MPSAASAAAPLEVPGCQAPPSLLELPWVGGPGFTVLSCPGRGTQLCAPPPPLNRTGIQPTAPPQLSLLGRRPAGHACHTCPSRAQIWGPGWLSGLGGAPCWGRSASGSSCHLQPGWSGPGTRAERQKPRPPHPSPVGLGERPWWSCGSPAGPLFCPRAWDAAQPEQGGVCSGRRPPPRPPHKRSLCPKAAPPGPQRPCPAPREPTLCCDPGPLRLCASASAPPALSPSGPVP